MNNMQFRLAQLRIKNQQVVIEAILVLIAALFTSALLPSLLVRYVYATQNLTSEPALLVTIPTVAFGVGILYFVYAMVSVMWRNFQAMKLEKEMMRLMPTGDGGLSGDELKELEGIVDSALAKTSKKTTAKRARSKKATK